MFTETSTVVGQNRSGNVGAAARREGSQLLGSERVARRVRVEGVGAGPRCARGNVEAALRLAEWLPADELALVHWVHRANRPISELAPAAGVHPWTLSRRLRAAMARLLRPTFRYVVAQLELASDPPPWPPRESGAAMSEERLALSIARGLFVANESVRGVALALGVDRRAVAWRRERVMLEVGAKPRRATV